jgi:hypothetical protein
VLLLVLVLALPIVIVIVPALALLFPIYVAFHRSTSTTSSWRDGRCPVQFKERHTGVPPTKTSRA